jgi:hypothetical protein
VSETKVYSLRQVAQAIRRALEAATGDTDDAYPYIRIADALLEYSVVIDELIKLDGKDEEWRATASSRPR